MYTLEAQVFGVKATHADHHALNIITTHSYIKTHINTADGIGVHVDAQQQVARESFANLTQLIDTRRTSA